MESNPNGIVMETNNIGKYIIQFIQFFFIIYKLKHLVFRIFLLIQHGNKEIFITDKISEFNIAENEIHFCVYDDTYMMAPPLESFRT